MKADPQLNHLLSALCDGIATPEQTQQLNDVLTSSRSARLAYLEYLDLHGELARRGEFQAAIERDGIAPPQISPIPFSGYAKIAAGLALAAAVILLIAVWLPRNTRSPLPDTEGPPIATVGFAENVRWNRVGDAPQVGTAVTPGPLELIEGKLGLKFVNGAELSLQAPAALDIRSASEIYMSHGEVAARVPESARGFSIRSDQLALVDIGTEFSMKVTDGKSGEVFVREGEVVASLLGTDGSTLREHDGTTGERLRWDADASVIESSRGNSAPLLSPFAMASMQLPITAPYVEAVKANQPLGYWRFESINAGVMPNEMSDRFAARIHGELQLEGVQNHVGIFGANAAPTLLQIQEGVPHLNEVNGYTFEAWVNPEAWQYATLLGLIEENFPPAQSAGDRGAGLNYLSVVELTRQTNSSAGLLHGDYRYRFLHRSPPGTASGFNAFSEFSYEPHQWHHLIAVKEGDFMEIYVNGELSRKVPVSAPQDEGSFHLLIGGLRPWGYPQQRNFVGRLDEVALYDRPLSSKEIRHHYELVAKPH